MQQGRSLRPPPPEFSEFCKIPRENGRQAKILYSQRNSILFYGHFYKPRQMARVLQNEYRQNMTLYVYTYSGAFLG